MENKRQLWNAQKDIECQWPFKTTILLTCKESRPFNQSESEQFGFFLLGHDGSVFLWLIDEYKRKETQGNQNLSFVSGSEER